MLVKLNEIFDTNNDLEAVCRKDLGAIKLSYKMSRNLKLIRKQVKEIKEFYNDLIKKHEDPKAKGRVDQAKMPDFTKEFNDWLSKEEAELDLWKVDTSEFGDVVLSPAELLSMDLFLTDGKPKATEKAKDKTKE